VQFLETADTLFRVSGQSTPITTLCTILPDMAYLKMGDLAQQIYMRLQIHMFVCFWSDHCQQLTNTAILMHFYGIEHDPTQWRLFIDSSKRSLKGVLLHSGNMYGSIPVAHSVHLKETYENMKVLLTSIQH
jgi:hypothetical protein